MINTCKKFILTKNLETVSILKKMGFQLISENNGQFYFLNDGKLLFEKLDGIAFTSKLTF